MKRIILTVLYYAAFALLYILATFTTAVSLFAYELFGPLPEETSRYQLLTSSLVPWTTKAHELVYVLLHVPLGVPLLFVDNYADWNWLGLPMLLGNALLLAWLLRRWLRRQSWQLVALAGVLVVDIGLWFW